MARGKFQNIVETVGDTPIVKINHLAPDHVTMWAKIEAFNPLGSVKDRLAMGIIEAAEASGELKPGQTVIEATSGNTGIGLAMVCAAKGYPFVSVMVETFSVERRKLMRFLGAKVILTPKEEKGMGMVTKCRELAETNGWFMTDNSKTRPMLISTSAPPRVKSWMPLTASSSITLSRVMAPAAH